MKNTSKFVHSKYKLEYKVSSKTDYIRYDVMLCWTVPPKAHGSSLSLCGTSFFRTFCPFSPEAVARWLVGVKLKERGRRPYYFPCVAYERRVDTLLCILGGDLVSRGVWPAEGGLRVPLRRGDWVGVGYRRKLKVVRFCVVDFNFGSG